MSEVGEHENFVWESQSWAFANSENSGSGGKPPDLGSNTQTPTGKEMEAVQAAAGGKKRSGGGKKKGKRDDGGIGGDGGEGNEGKSGGESDHEIHIWTERERRKKMRNMFSNLHALLPQLPPKADKSTIVDEAVNYIRTLQQTLQKLQRKKLERLHGVTPINYDPSVVTPQKLAIESREAFIADQVSSSNLANTSTPANSNSSNSVLPFISRFPPIFQTWTSQNVILNVCGEQAQINICAPKKPGLFTAICYVLEKHKIDVVSAHVSSDQNWTMLMIQAHEKGTRILEFSLQPRLGESENINSYSNVGESETESMGYRACNKARIAHDQLPEAFPVEEIYKQAAGEIMLWLSS